MRKGQATRGLLRNGDINIRTGIIFRLTLSTQESIDPQPYFKPN